MAIDFITMLPTSGDRTLIGKLSADPSRVDPWRNISDREPSLANLISIVQAAEKGGFDATLLPTGNVCLDSLVTASALVSHTEKIKFLFAARPGFTAPAIFARQIGTLDYLSGGRALINVVTGKSPAELAADGDFVPHDARYDRTAEFIHVLKRLFTEDHFDHEGDYYKLRDASLFYKSVQKPRPLIYFGGASEAGKRAAVKEADVYMLWAESLDLTRERIEEVKALAALENRVLDYSISFQVILGDTEEEAWRRADEIIRHVDPAVIARKETEVTIKDESIGDRRLQKLMNDSRANDFRIGPNVWAGLTQVMGGNSIALVGTPDQVADRILDYADLGFTKVLLRGLPFLETITAIGRDVIPRVREKEKARQRDSDSQSA
ncbi:LLM class flavin-dependent oxidoreductase [Paenibacillus sp. XY044]|uniref:LLM class flavin-dependent oxidoreductase n=1 Tax=Paenibacillus sp. XY044 TaxID=2026089 RepID=UPI000B99561F|nr:LLM class flavin-dependent oxidoreductase [Paenibacillus sp. XY044]OZB95369.1 alkanesulfonate monooxygenase [Paenibacillus sp. XY044]